MSFDQELTKVPDSFSGVARLFPLPNLVLFPHVIQPLHIFEPRYREMLADSLEDDQLIAMAKLAPGWENDYDGRPRIEPTVCLGRIVSCSEDSLGHYNLFLLGLTRGRLRKELPADRSYREAQIDILSDVYPEENAAHRSSLQRKLVRGVRDKLPRSSTIREQFERLFDQSAPLGMLADVAAFTMAFGLDDKQQLLAEPNVVRRADRVLELLATRDDPVEPVRPFPPGFSSN